MTDPASHVTDTTAVPTPPNISGYRLLKPIGMGGMSAVYLAEQISLGRKVAIKLMGPNVAASTEACDRFVREARAAAAVNHPNVVSIIDVGQATGQLYMVLELVTGGDAAQLADQHGGILPETRALEIMVDCAKGLEALHEANLVHRDLKPSNIFLTRDGTAKVGDLGLARSAAGIDRMTSTGHLIGTPAFMSPEQAGGEKLDIRSDIYSLGATLFALVTGRQPFVANTPIAVAAKAMVEPTPNPLTFNPHLSAPLVEVVLRCMAKEPAQRFQSPKELRLQLEKILANKAGIPSLIPPASHAADELPPSRWNALLVRRKTILGIAAGVLLLSMPFLWWSQQNLLLKPESSSPSSTSASSPSSPNNTFQTPGSSQPSPSLSPIPREPSQPVWSSAFGRDQYGTWSDLTVADVRQRFRYIPPGKCAIGSAVSEVGHREVENLSDVTFSFGVWMADTECSQALWEAVMSSNPSQTKNPRLPVTDIDMQSAIHFTHQLSQRVTNGRVRLPSRAEWERACRAGSRTAYATGDDPESLAGYANLHDMDRHRAVSSRKVVNFSDGFVDLAPVASLKPNAWGLFDMHGNVYEYCLADRWAPLPGICTDPFIDDGIPSEISFIRGGAYTSEDTDKTRCASLPYVTRGSTGIDIGFRFLIVENK